MRRHKVVVAGGGFVSLSDTKIYNAALAFAATVMVGVADHGALVLKAAHGAREHL